MESLNRTDKVQENTQSFLNKNFNKKIREKISDKFDLSLIGKIDLAEAEKIAQEEILFLNEIDLIEGLEEFELVPLKNFKYKETKDDTLFADEQIVEKKEIISAEQISNNTIQEFEIKNYEDNLPTEITDVSNESADIDNIQQLPDENLHLDFFEPISSKNENESNVTDNIPTPDSQISQILNEENETLNSEIKSVLPEIKPEESIEEPLNLKVQIGDNQILPEDFNVQNQFYVRDILDLREKTFNELSKTNLFDTTSLNPDHLVLSDLEINFITNIFESDDFDDFINTVDNYTFLNNKKWLNFNYKLNLYSDELGFIEQKLFHNNIQLPIINTNIDNEFHDSRKLQNYSTNTDQIVFEEKTDDLENYAQNLENLQIRNIQDNDSNSERIIKGEFQDITDRIIILEDKEMLDVLANRFPDKQQNLIKLLSYLDGLFEKLPEEVIHKFVESEYFGLYSTLLQEIGD